MNLNIEDYLNSLPLDITKIDVSSRGLTYLPDLSRFKELIHLNCSYNEITELPHLNNKLQYLYCSENQLTGLPPLNDNLIYLDCSENQLTGLPPLNDNLTQLYCYYNELTSLPPLNNNLIQLYCFRNQLTWLPPLNKLQLLNCSDNNIYNENIEKYKYDYRNINIIKTLNNFRYTYYCLKYKNHFKRWLWEKVREPKIMAKFHPSHLDALEETDDLEVFLDDWIKE
jgi:Leucine-rich repeat (LRR) protein